QRDEDATAVTGAERHEALQQRAVRAAESQDGQRAAGASPGGDVGKAIVVDVAGSHAHAAAEVGVIGGKAGQDCPIDAAKRPDVTTPAGAGAGDDVGPAVAIDVARSYVDAAAEAGVVCVKAPQHATVHSAKRLDVRRPAGACAGDDVGPAVAIDVARSY